VENAANGDQKNVAKTPGGIGTTPAVELLLGGGLGAAREIVRARQARLSQELYDDMGLLKSNGSVRAAGLRDL
jgi:hypothetical protein